MPLIKKTLTFFARLTEGKFFKEVDDVDPTIKASFARASTVSTAACAASLQEGAVDVVKQSFYQTADDDFLELIGDYDNTVRFDAQPSVGFGAAPGVLSTLVPQGESVTYLGNTFLTTADATVQEYTGDIALTFSAGLVTAVTSIDHTLSTGLTVNISSAGQSEYNGDFVITVINSTTFTYELTAGALTPDTGVYTSVYALLPLESSGTGSDKNAGSGAEMAINFTNLDGQVFVGNDGLSGGLDEENIDDYRDRVGEAHNLTPGISTPPSIVFSAKSVPGNTRIFVVRPDGTVSGTPGDPGYKPDLGETVVYVIRDNDPSIIPDAGELTATKDKIIADGQWPTFIPDDKLYVIAPTLVTQDFNFTEITPDTTTMRNAITTQLPAFFQENSDVEGTEIKLSQIDAFLQQVQDQTTGQFLQDFTYTIPAADITPAEGELYTLGTVTFP